MLEAWSEGDLDGSPGAANAVERMPNVDWTAAAAGPGSRGSVALAELAAPLANTQYTIGLPLDVVQRWVDDPPSNHGVALVPASSGTLGVAFHSSEAVTPALRPTLRLGFRP
mgnify:CR=1 FL=1